MEHLEGEGAGLAGGTPAAGISQAIAAVMAANLTGVKPDFDRIRIPAGGGLSFAVDCGGMPKAFPELSGVIVDHYPVNVYFRDPYRGPGHTPDCLAVAGGPGRGQPGGSCAACRHGAWESEVADDGALRRAKACRSLRRVYVLTGGRLFPCLLTLPPTSGPAFAAYMKQLTVWLLPYYAVVTGFKLARALNRDRLPYSQVEFACAGRLPPAALAAVKQYAAAIRAYTRQQEFTEAEPQGQADVG